MSRADLRKHFSKINDLISEIDSIVPSGTYKADKFRSDLAGLLIISIAATYETCVKEVLIGYASNQHSAFGDYALRSYEKLNSKIQVNDLKKYCSLFDPSIAIKFRKNLTSSKANLLSRTGRNIETSYEQILEWRHAFAHAGIRSTTVEEAAATHRAALRILYIFDSAFH